MINPLSHGDYYEVWSNYSSRYVSTLMESRYEAREFIKEFLYNPKKRGRKNSLDHLFPKEIKAFRNSYYIRRPDPDSLVNILYYDKDSGERGEPIECYSLDSNGFRDISHKIAMGCDDSLEHQLIDAAKRRIDRRPKKKKEMKERPAKINEKI